MKRTLPSQAYLNQCFEYDPLAGVLRWRARPIEHFADERAYKVWNTRYAGKEFGSPDGQGYRHGAVGGINWRAHRIIWKLVHNEEPPEVDHKNRDRSDDRLDNLRAATSSQNRCNRAVVRTDKLRGVFLNWKRWSARIAVKKKYIHLGTYDTPEQAHAAYLEAVTKYHGEFAAN